MRTFINLALLLCVLPLISNCTSGNENERTSRELSLRAAIATTCTTEITFNDLDDNVYAYRADDLFGVPSVQAGGHSDPDQLTDLGVNVFADLESLVTGNYSIDGGNALPGTAYVYYIPGAGTQYTSTGNNTENLVIEILEINEEGTLTKLKGTFNNVEVANITNPDDKLCINEFELIFTL